MRDVLETPVRKETPTKQRKPYVPPVVQLLGRLDDLTMGAGGSKDDKANKTLL